MAKRFTLPTILIVFCLTAAGQTRPDTLKKDSLKNYKLNEVTIKSKFSAIQVLTDKVLLNVDAMPGSTGLNLLELLKQSPGISVDGQDNIKMSGKKGIQVMIDGRLQLLSGQQLASLLKATPAANIKTIELISNPSAKYDAAGNAGIINLIFKRPAGDGTTLNLSAGYQFTRHFRQNASFALNSKIRKLLVFANGSYDNSLQYTSVSSIRILPDKIFEQQGIERQGYSNPNLRTGIEYSLSKTTKIGTVVSLQHEWEDFPSTARTIVNGASPNIVNTSTTANNTQNRLGLNLNFQYQDTLGNSLNAEGDWLMYHSILDNTVNNEFPPNSQFNFKNDTHSDIDLYSLKADYSHKTKNTTLETGLKVAASYTDNQLSAGQDDLVSNKLATSIFNYKENIYAGYISFKHQNTKWSYQLGLRAEATQMNSILKNPQPTPIRDTTYVALFPSIFIRYQFNENFSVGLNYAKRIDRPGFQDQNPYLYRTDVYLANQGNPLLLPQFTHSVSVDAALKNSLQLKFSYSYTIGLMETLVIQQDEQTLLMPANMGNRALMSFSVSTPFKISKYWSGYAVIEPNYQFYRADLSTYPGLNVLKTEGAGISGSISNTFSLSDTWKAGLSAWLSYSSRTALYRNTPIYSIDLSAKKMMFSGKGNVSLAYRDLFNTQRFRQRALSGNIDQTSYRKWESSGPYIGFSYSLGSGKIKNGNSGKGKPEELQRIKGRG